MVDLESRRKLLDKCPVYEVFMMYAQKNGVVISEGDEVLANIGSCPALGWDDPNLRLLGCKAHQPFIEFSKPFPDRHDNEVLQRMACCPAILALPRSDDSVETDRLDCEDENRN